IDVYHTHWKRMLAGEDWGERNFGRRREPQPKEQPKDKDKAKDKASPKPKNKAPGGAALSGSAQPEPQRRRNPGGPHERNHEAIRAAFRDAVAPSGPSLVRVLA